jgi:general secretion pathway protein J
MSAVPSEWRRASPAAHAAGGGFTLIELLVALFIAAIMFAMGYGAINQALQSRGAIRREQRELMQLQTTMSVMEQDFVQLAPRPVRSPDGNNYLFCLQGGPMSETSDASDASATSDSSSSSAPLVVLTRGGWSNPSGLPRTELERVAYVFDDGTLVREHWNVLDGTLSSTPVKRNLLKHLRSVSFRYMQPATHGWVNTWPSSALGGQNLTDSFYRQRPMAVEVTLDTKQWGRITRIFEVAQ